MFWETPSHPLPGWLFSLLRLRPPTSCFLTWGRPPDPLLPGPRPQGTCWASCMFRHPHLYCASYGYAWGRALPPALAPRPSPLHSCGVNLGQWPLHHSPEQGLGACDPSVPHTGAPDGECVASQWRGCSISAYEPGSAPSAGLHRAHRAAWQQPCHWHRTAATMLGQEGTAVHVPKPTKQGFCRTRGTNSRVAQGHRLQCPW